MLLSRATSRIVALSFACSFLPSISIATISISPAQ
jgi:hypothetical protein